MQTWLIDGLVIPYQVAGSSMAETLLGVHRDVVCGDCGCPFSCGTDRWPAALRAVCPNCGYAANDLESLPDIGGDYVLIDRTAFSIRPPRRWEVVAFRRSSQADQIVVKRVVGLPGESIEIRHGDVYADGRLLRKNLAQQRALAVLVHDADFQPRRGPPRPRRWRAERSDTHWTAAGGGFTHAAGANDTPIDWIIYHHGRQLPVTDLSGYNPSQPRREEDVHPVSDLMLSFRLGYVSGRGTFRVRTSDGRDRFEVWLTFDGDQPRYRVFRNDRLLPGAGGKISAAGGNWLVEVSLVDQQFLLALDGQTLVAWPYARPGPPQLPTSCPLALGVQGLHVSVGGLRIYRDVYYTDPMAARGPGQNTPPVCSGAGQYYVLGDNSPVSEDSRQWSHGGEVDAKLFVGKPLVAITPARLSLGGWWHFQVPNPAQIRYIW
jgi:signal peptidase I